jgi:GDSL-like Lipase/Acylhydrolase family
MTDTRESLEERRETATAGAAVPHEARAATDPQRAAAVLGTAVACYVASCGWFFFVRDRSRWLWAPALAGVVLAALAVNWSTRRFVDRDRSAWMTWAVRGLILALVAAGAGLLYLFVRWDLSGGFAFLGVAFLFLGLGLAISWLRWTGARWTAWLGVAILVACGVLVTVGTFRLSSGEVGDALTSIVVGVLLTPVGLALVSGYVIHDPGDRPIRDVGRLRVARSVSSWVAGAVGLVVVVTVLAVVASQVPDRLVVIGGGVLFVLVLTVTARSNADIVVVVAAVAVVLTLEPTGAVPPEHATVEDGEDVVVAMGDSFMSGEGAASYLAGINTKDLNECRRAPTAYPVRLVGPELAGAPAEDVLFVACSGAKADHLHTRVQHAGDPVDNTVGGLDQLDHAATVVGDHADVDVRMVLVSVGGNDALFGSVVKACALPGDCSELRESMLGQIDHVRSEVREAYERIDEAYPGVPVAVVPYPVPLAESNVGCDYSPFGENEHEFIHEFARELNAMLRAEAAEPGIDFHYVSTMPAALRDHRLCDGPAGRVGVNLIAANGVGGLFQQRINPTNWFHNSAHPNQRGHDIMGRTLAAWLADQQPLSPRAAAVAGSGSGSGAGVTTDDAGTADTCTGRTGRDLATCAERWAWAEASRFLRAWGPWLVALTAGMWLVAVFLVRHLARSVGRPLADWSRRLWTALTARRAPHPVR